MKLAMKLGVVWCLCSCGAGGGAARPEHPTAADFAPAATIRFSLSEPSEDVTALAHWDAEELGRAVDLLTSRAERFEWASVFRQERGQFYLQRDLHDKALKGLKVVIDAVPGARLARMAARVCAGGRVWRDADADAE